MRCGYTEALYGSARSSRTQRADLGPCDDADACTLEGTSLCAEGICVPGTPVECSGLDAECVTGVCNPVDGTCGTEPADEGGLCDDGDRCTVDGTSLCAEGICAPGTPVDCSGLDAECMAGVCDPVDGTCGTEPTNEGAVCDDGDLCTEDGTSVCAGGTCTPGSSIDCGDLDALCSVGTCDDTDGACLASPAPDGSACAPDPYFCAVGAECAAGACDPFLPDCPLYDYAHTCFERAPLAGEARVPLQP